MRFLLVASVALSSGCVGWTHVNTAAEVLFVGTQFIDYRQTDEAVGYCAEGNPLIGRCGQVTSPAGYFLLTTLLHVGIAAALPKRWREVFQAVTFVSQAANVYSNVATLELYRVEPGGRATR
jgi:hypothetical protein